MKTTKDLPCKLSTEKLAEKRSAAADHGLAYRDIEDRIAELRKLAKVEMDRLTTLAKEIRDGTEVRPVKCVEVIETRAMTADERQVEIGETTATGGKRKLQSVPKEVPPPAEKGEPH
jgi:hypothetical protein